MSNHNLDRRSLLKTGLKTASVLGLGVISNFSTKAASHCRITSEQTEGPFYPIKDQLDKNSDLTQVQGRKQKALGEIVTLKGVVRDDNCKPVKNALVEIWQACSTGKYNHPGDPNTAKLDPNFQYWGRSLTNSKGEYKFKTIIPGRYQATNNWIRPPHIHMKVHLRGYEELTTQVYFAEEKNLNSKDRILQSLNRQDQDDVIVHFKKENEKELYREGTFDITIKNF